MEKTDVIIIGSGFSGLTLAHHLHKSLNAVVLDKKAKLNSEIESTGLITQVTKDLLAEFVDVDRYIPNRIDSICVVNFDYSKHFISKTKTPWIYSTDTPELVKHMAETVPTNIKIKLGTTFLSYSINANAEYPVTVEYRIGDERKQIKAKFIVGADGSDSAVAKSNPDLSRNKNQLVGFEKVFYGDILLGDDPESTVYHFWFGEFSLGYGGWLSPTIINGKKAFRLGLAKLRSESKGLQKVNRFIEILQEKKIIEIDSHHKEPIVQFCHGIPIGGTLKSVSDKYSALVGDAAGFCGAFAADGIKGSVLSGKVAAKLIKKRLSGDTNAFKNYHSEIQKFNRMMTYYRKQVFYRKIWDIMKSNRTFDALYNLVEREKSGFLNQFCDSKDRNRSLTKVILRWRNIKYLLIYSIYMTIDLFKRRHLKH